MGGDLINVWSLLFLTFIDFKWHNCWDNDDIQGDRETGKKGKNEETKIQSVFCVMGGDLGFKKFYFAFLSLFL